MQRIDGDELLELGKHAVVPTELQVGPDADLEAPEPELVEPCRLVADESFGREIRERFSTPELERIGAEPSGQTGI